MVKDKYIDLVDAMALYLFERELREKIDSWQERGTVVSDDYIKTWITQNFDLRRISTYRLQAFQTISLHLSTIGATHEKMSLRGLCNRVFEHFVGTVVTALIFFALISCSSYITNAFIYVTNHALGKISQ